MVVLKLKSCREDGEIVFINNAEVNMKKLRTWIFLALLVCGVLVLPQTSNAISLVYEATNLMDTTVGEDLWEYKYTLSDLAVIQYTGFTIFFDPVLYGDIEDFPPASAPNADWDVLTFDPDPFLPDDGVYDALALIDAASLLDPFIVEFVWLGAGTPGAQPFELYEYNPLTDSATSLSSAVTSPIPEPSTWVLLTSGIFGLVGVNRWKKWKA